MKREEERLKTETKKGVSGANRKWKELKRDEGEEGKGGGAGVY